MNKAREMHLALAKEKSIIVTVTTKIYNLFRGRDTGISFAAASCFRTELIPNGQRSWSALSFEIAAATVL